MVGFCAIAVALPMPWFTEFWVVGLLTWLLLFFGGFIVPPLTGVMINSVPPKHRTSANSISNLLQNLLGFLPAPFLYGLITKYTGGAKSMWGMFMLFYSSILTISYLVYGINKKLSNERAEEARRSTVAPKTKL